MKRAPEFQELESTVLCTGHSSVAFEDVFYCMLIFLKSVP